MGRGGKDQGACGKTSGATGSSGVRSGNQTPMEKGGWLGNGVFR